MVVFFESEYQRFQYKTSINYYPNGNVKESYRYTLRNGDILFNGERRKYYEFGGIEQIINYQMNFKHGNDITFGTDGDIKCIQKFNEGELMETQYFDKNIRDIIRVYPNDIRIHITFVKDVMTSQSTYKKDYLHGRRSTFYKNGQLKTHEDYILDVLHGLYALFYESGGIRVYGTYENGRRIGNWFHYHPNGLIRKVERLKY